MRSCLAAQSSIESTVDGRVSLLTVVVEIEHDRPGDLIIELVHGDKRVRLHNQEDTDAPLKIQLTTDAGDLQHFVGEDARGTWVLIATDVRSGAAGSIERWSLSLVSE